MEDLRVAPWSAARREWVEKYVALGLDERAALGVRGALEGGMLVVEGELTGSFEGYCHANRIRLREVKDG